MRILLEYVVANHSVISRQVVSTEYGLYISPILIASQLYAMRLLCSSTMCFLIKSQGRIWEKERLL